MTDIPAPCNVAHEDFHARYPVLADRIMIHGDGGPSAGFETWFQTELPDYGRLFDIGDKQSVDDLTVKEEGELTDVRK